MTDLSLCTEKGADIPLLELYLATHPGPRKVLVIDLDGTDNPTRIKAGAPVSTKK